MPAGYFNGRVHFDELLARCFREAAAAEGVSLSSLLRRAAWKLLHAEHRPLVESILAERRRERAGRISAPRIPHAETEEEVVHEVQIRLFP